MLLITIDFEVLALAGSHIRDRLVGQVHLHLSLMIFGDAVKELLEERLGDDDGEHKVVQLIVLMNVSEERADDYAEAVTGDGPCGMLSAGARAKVLSCHKDTARVAGIVEDEVLLQAAVFVIAPVAEEVIAEAFLVSSLEEAGGDDLVCIYILQGKRNAAGCDDIEFLFHCDKNTDVFNQEDYMNSRGSVTLPVIAAAAATSGLARMVREPGP